MCVLTDGRALAAEEHRVQVEDGHRLEGLHHHQLVDHRTDDAHLRQTAHVDADLQALHRRKVVHRQLALGHAVLRL